MYTKKLFPALIFLLILTGCTHKPQNIPAEIEKEGTSKDEVGLNDPVVVEGTLDFRVLHLPKYYGNMLSGETSHTSDLDIENWLAKLLPIPDYGQMIPAGEVLQMIAVGGGMTAGAQNGGLYRSGQLAAYPNLVARQLGMKGFTTPVFDKTEANGTGYALHENQGNGEQHLQKVSNNLAHTKFFSDGTPPEMNSFSGSVHNYSAPFLTAGGIGGTTWAPWMVGKSVNNLNGLSWNPSLPYLWRFSEKEHYSSQPLISYIKGKQDYNFFLLEDMNEVFFNALRVQVNRELSMGDMVGDMMSGTPHSLSVIRSLAAAGQKGVIFTVPDFKNLGYASHKFTSLSVAEIGSYEAAVRVANRNLRAWADEFNLAVVDLAHIYQQINTGNYRTDDGLSVSGSLTGNFFSSDGIYPTVLGQAVIANEVLKAINQKYQMKVPLIDIREYLTSIGYAL